MLIIGILAAIVGPRFFERQTFDALGFHDQALSMFRYGQKTAVAQRRNVFVNVDSVAGRVCLTYVADVNCTNPAGVVNPADGDNFSQIVPPGVALGSNLSFAFSPLGSPTPDPGASIVLNIVGGGLTRVITVERDTGYVH